MNTFNLTFWGEILEGRDPQKVKARFGKMFAIDDPERIDHFFSGDTIILRRNLERKVAAEYYSKLRKLGVEVELVKVDPAAALAEQRRAVTPAPTDSAVAESTTSPTDKSEDQPENKPANKRAQWEEARRIAELESQQRKAVRAAEREEAQRKAEATAAQRRAEQAALKQQQAEAELRRKEREEALQREFAKAEAQRKAELETLRKQQAREAAKRKAARDEAKRIAAEEAALRKAELAEKKRIAKEKAAAEKARLAEEKRRAAEAAEKQRALEAEQRRKEEQARKEQVAKEKARLAEEKRKAAEAAEKQRALEAEQRRKEEQARKKQAAKEKTRLARQKRKAADAAEKQRVLKEEQRLKEEQAKKEEAARKKAARDAESARLREEQEIARREEKARREAERARVAQERARQRAEREHRQAEEKRRLEEERKREEEIEREQAAQRKLMEEQAIARAAEELSDMAALKPGQAKVKSGLDLPRRNTDTLPPKTKRQTGAPNFYSMHPFRNTTEVRERAALASKSKRGGLIAATLALAALLVLTGRYLGLEPEAPVNGPSNLATSPAGALLIQAGETLLLHDRAGVGVQTIGPDDAGAQGIEAPMTYEASGNLLVHARSSSRPDADPELYRCADDLISCAILYSGDRAQAMATHPLTGQVFLTTDTGLIKLSAEGELLARTALPLPDAPVLQLDSGLLFMNSAEGPAISVFRYENNAFGKQLDEVLLLPPPALEKEQASVRDFVRAGAYWWVKLHNPESGSSGIYVFDSNWSYLHETPLEEPWQGARLTSWGQKILLWRPDSAVIKRFAASGNVEADLESDLLAALIDEQQKKRQLNDAAWAAAFSALIIIAAVGAALGYHQYLRSLVYRSRPTRGAESIDEHTEDILWVDPVTDLNSRTNRLWLSYGALTVALTLLCVGLGASVSQLTAVLIALCGPAIALALFSRSRPAHAGVLDNQLVLVDHRDMYHMASGARILYRGPFLLIDDVIVFTGSTNLPALSQEQLASRLNPLAQAGIRVDRKTVIVKLLEAHHPLARGATFIALAVLAATVVFAAGQLL